MLTTILVIAILALAIAYYKQNKNFSKVDIASSFIIYVLYYKDKKETFQLIQEVYKLDGSNLEVDAFRIKWTTICEILKITPLWVNKYTLDEQTLEDIALKIDHLLNDYDQALNKQRQIQALQSIIGLS